MKKALQLASVASMIDQFNIPNIRILQSLGYEVDVIADFTNPGTITKGRAEELKNLLSNMNVRVIDISIPRSINPIAIYIAYKQVKKILEEEHYTLIHCHSPIGGAIARFAAKRERRKGTKVIYTAHGFHFYHGAPLKNWILFYPIEKYLSNYTDVLITINREDYDRASRSFFANRTVYVPGVGVDTSVFKTNKNRREIIRKELGLNEDRTMVLSVGELNENKNHIAVLRALAGLDFTYVIVGNGKLKNMLNKEAAKENVDLRLMGFRNDVVDFYNAADVFVLPSFREGLNVSLIEAMACGLPCAVSRIRGNVDLVDHYLFDPDNKDEIRTAIVEAIDNREKIATTNIEKAACFDVDIVQETIRSIYIDSQ